MPGGSDGVEEKKEGGGTQHRHRSGPPEGLTCALTWDDIDEEEYVEYRTSPSGEWHVSKYSALAVRQLIKTQFQKYMDDVEKASKDCAAAVRRLVNAGPPIYLSDKNALPIPEGDTHIDAVWYCSTGREESAELEGALRGDAREELWNAQKMILASMEAAESGGSDESKSAHK